MNKTVLIVDDSPVNRKLLRKMLHEEYDILEAGDGKQALECLRRSGENISAILLDLVMPEMDGYAFLRAFSKEKDSELIPVIVSTGQSDKDSEIKALRLGAWDFVTKPYVPEILHFRLNNAILRSQLTAFQELKYKSEFDVLTDIYNRDTFFADTEHMLRTYPEEAFSFIRLDVDRFHLVNTYFGLEVGNELLRYIATELKQERNSFPLFTFGRIEADIFACCVPTQNKTQLGEFVQRCNRSLKRFDSTFDISATFGICLITDPKLSASELYDRANLAAKRCKGNYLMNYGYYTEAMGRDVEQEQEIINEMDAAIAQEQFEVWYQPKMDIRTNTPAGAEALVRWRHPQKGLISPASFISIFEHNGFIYRLDHYVWERVCRDLRRWQEEGCEVHPVSVNVSRVDLSDPHLLENILALTERYGIAHELLQLEVTESAYTDNPERMIELIRAFQAQGFVILMDDFGSGYSSLSVLKDIDVNILKIDMHFFAETAVEGRSKSIIASVLRMAKWLEIPVVAEGVEQREQVDFLRGLGCEYIQGYYFAKPMPEQDYLSYLQTRLELPGKDSLRSFDAETVWQSDTVMDEIMQPAALLEFDGRKVEILHVNNSFYDFLGFRNQKEHFEQMSGSVQPEFRQSFLSAFQIAAEQETGAEVEYRHLLADGGQMWVHLKIRFIHRLGNRSLFYGIFSDVTTIRQLDAELTRYRTTLLHGEPKTGKMLLVDDVEVNRASLRTMFAPDFELLEAGDGKEALTLLEQTHGGVDAILLDLMMPVMDGRTFLEQVKADSRFSSIPVIVITADDNAAQQAETMALGADDYIVKPFVEQVVIRRVKNVLAAQERRSLYHQMSEAIGK